MYYRTTSTPSNESFSGTYQFISNRFGQKESESSVDYLAVAYLQDMNEGEFSIYNSLNGVIQKGKCQRDGDYIVLSSDDKRYLLFFTHKNYYFIADDLKPEKLEKISDEAIE